MVAEGTLSIRQIDLLEDAADVLVSPDGADSIVVGATIRALLDRWRHGLRDSETTIRLVFHLWSDSQGFPRQRILPEPPLPSATSILEEAGGVEALPPESHFAVAFLAHIIPWALGSDVDEWERMAPAIAARAAAREPSSQLFQNWRYYFGQTVETEGLWKHLMAEVHARFDGRGAYGAYMRHMLTARRPGTY